MARKSKAQDNGNSGNSATVVESARTPGSQLPLVFISHDSRDADLAEEFDNLLRDASGGMLKSFRSSDKKGTAGMEYGEEWYNAIMSRLESATDVVALLTPYSLGRPWILYEAGVAKGKIGGKVLGLVIGMPFEKATSGPFYQFQNCADDEDSLTGLVMQLIKRNPTAEPRTEAVRIQVQAFRTRIESIVKQRGQGTQTSPQVRVEDSPVAKLFEEVKVMFRELPEKVESKLQETVGRRVVGRKSRFHPMMIEELLFNPLARESKEGEAATWLLLGSLCRDELPWLHEVSMQMYRALSTKNATQIKIAREAALSATRIFSKSRGMYRFMRDGDMEVEIVHRHLPDMLEHYFSQVSRVEKKTSRASAKKN